MTKRRKINWKKRFENKAWLVMAASAVLLGVQAILALFGVTFDGQKWLTAVNILLGILTAIGVVVDPTTKGIGDGE